jgi:hypothetical protein
MGSSNIMSAAARTLLIAPAIALLTLFLAACVAIPPPGPGAPTISPKGAFTLRSAPVRGAAARFSLGHISGAPEDVAITTTNTLTSQAKTRNLNFTATDDPTATYHLRGYLSAVGDREGTILVYVWDVFDSKGVRLHRISGQERGSGTSSDPWGGIKDSTIQSAARDTIDDLVAWAGSGKE